jgi:integrase/recombinase XerD
LIFNDIESEHYDSWLFGHAKLNSTAFYTKVATRTVRTVTSPLDKLGLFKPEESSPDG